MEKQVLQLSQPWDILCRKGSLRHVSPIVVWPYVLMSKFGEQKRCMG